MKWLEFGKCLADSRLSAGIAQQSELATTLGVSQQTVSRWEQGASRPRAVQIPEIAAAVNAEASELLEAAGYVPSSKMQTSLDLPWPVDALLPETFERFCTDLLTCLHGSKGHVTRFGSQGHTQQGLDIEAVFSDKSRFTYQCKKHKAFGPKKIAEAVADHTAKAKKKFILFSGLASPQSREEIKKHADWYLWDREDITRYARLDLPKVDQQRLVDIYFPGQRLALLGELEPSPWRQPGDFFAGMVEPTSAFSHAWALEGRDSELEKLKEFATQQKTRAILLVGNGGTGKSRLLKALSDHLEATHKSSQRILFLARDPLRSKDLEALGSELKILVCDDAHDRDDIALLADYVANPANNAFLVLSLRGYGERQLLQQAGSLKLADLPKIELKKLSQKESEALAAQALSQFGGDKNHVSRLACYTQDCPLATVVGAQILSTGESLPDFLIDEDSFRNELMRKLVRSTVSGVSSGLNEDSVHVTLGAIALLQPIKDDDAALADALGKVASLSPHEVARILKRLREASVLFQRATGSRIAPDLLGDFLVEDQCISASGTSSGFAENIFDAVPDAYAEHILLNLGRLDWRRSNGVTRQSRLLDHLWSRLNWNSAYGNAHLRAAAVAAYYQPRQALEFARRMLRNGHKDEQLARIVRNVSYDFEHLTEACEVLWEIGRDDNRPLHQQPSHGVRLLSELASPEPGKPVIYMEGVVNFAISLFSMDDSWRDSHTPIEILTGALKTEGHTSTSTGRAISMTSFLVSQSAVADVRRKVIDSLIGLLTHPDGARSVRAAGAIHKALRYPHGMLGAKVDKEMIRKWDDDFLSTLTSINSILDHNKIPPTVLVKLASSVSWHAQHGHDQIKTLSQSIIDRLEGDLCTRTVRMLVDGWGHLTREKKQGNWNAQQEELQRFAKELVAKFDDSDELHEYMNDCLEEVAAMAASAGSPQILMGQLIECSTSYARTIMHRSIENAEEVSSAYAGSALTKLLRSETTEAHAQINWLINQEDPRFLLIVAEAYWRYRPTDSYKETDILALHKITTSKDPRILRNAAGALREVAAISVDLAIDLAISADFEVSPEATHEYLLWLCSKDTIPYERLKSDQVQVILTKLSALKDIEDYWVQSFIKSVIRNNPELVIEFFKLRVCTARDSHDWSYRPVPWSAPNEGDFGLMDRADAILWLRDLFDWALAEEQAGKSVVEWFGDLIKSLSCNFNDIFIEFIESWITSTGRLGVEIAFCVLRESPSNFVIEQSVFVGRLLRQASIYGADTLKDARSKLFVSILNGGRSGSPGEPFPQDIAIRDGAKNILSSLGRFEPSYELYRDILKHAELEIERQITEGSILDALDEE
jgi:transcriptional regulator with XRE-family HTH domain